MPELSVQYNNYKHAEMESLTGEIGTAFKNNTFLYQGLFDQREAGKLSGRFGFWGMHRDFSASGEEALAPLQSKMRLPCLGFELGLRTRVAAIRRSTGDNRYKPEATDARGVLPDRNFTGFSGAAGIRVRTWNGGASLPTILILIELPHWRSCTTLDHTQATWRLRSVTQTCSENSETAWILDFGILQSGFDLRPMASTTTSKLCLSGAHGRH